MAQQYRRDVLQLVLSGACYPHTRVSIITKYPILDGVPFKDGKCLFGIVGDTTDFQNNRLLKVQLQRKQSSSEPGFVPKRLQTLGECVYGVFIKLEDGSCYMLGPMFNDWRMADYLQDLWKYHSAAVAPEVLGQRQDSRKRIYQDISTLSHHHLLPMSIEELFVSINPDALSPSQSPAHSAWDVSPSNSISSGKAEASGSKAADAVGSSMGDTVQDDLPMKQPSTKCASSSRADKASTARSSPADDGPGRDQDNAPAASLAKGLKGLSITETPACQDSVSSRTPLPGRMGVLDVLPMPRDLSSDFGS